LTNAVALGEEEKEEVQVIWFCKCRRHDGSDDRATGSRDRHHELCSTSSGYQYPYAKKLGPES